MPESQPSPSANEPSKPNQPDVKSTPGGSGKPELPPRKPNRFMLVLAGGLLLMLVVSILQQGDLAGQVKQISSGEFHAYVQKDAQSIKSITFVTSESSETNTVRVKGEFAEGRSADLPSRFETKVSRDMAIEAEKLAPEGGFDVKWETDSNIMTSIIVTLLPVLLIFLLLWLFVFRRSSGMGGPGGVFGFGKSRAKLFNKQQTQVRFDDVAGIEEAKQELSEIVQFLKHPAKFTRIGAKIPRGVLMFGPPGCGKTLLAKSIAGEAERPFFSISGSDFVEMFVGVGASRVRDLFKVARENAPAIIFIDEIDAVGRKRGTGVGGGHDEREQTLNAILVEMDGIGTEEGLIVVAATNRPDVLDGALLRPGRFDRQVSIDLPDAAGRAEIFKVHLQKIKFDEAVDTEELASATPGFSGADIANLVNEAALAAVLNERSLVMMTDLLEARDKVRFGRQKKSRKMVEEDRRIIAYHESGHTLIQYITPNTDPVHKVTIIPRGMALGATMSLPEKDRYLMSRSECNELIQVLFGGRIAEDKFIGEISSGASDDIKRATKLAKDMVVRYGFSDELGPLNYADENEHDAMGGLVSRINAHSDSTTQKIDAEIRKIIDSNFKLAVEMIESNRDKMEALTQALLTYETLDSADVKWIMEGKPIAEKREQDKEKKRQFDAAQKLKQDEEEARKAREEAAADSRTSNQSFPRPYPAN